MKKLALALALATIACAPIPKKPAKDPYAEGKKHFNHFYVCKSSLEDYKVWIFEDKEDTVSISTDNLDAQILRVNRDVIITGFLNGYTGKLVPIQLKLKNDNKAVNLDRKKMYYLPKKVYLDYTPYNCEVVY